MCVYLLVHKMFLVVLIALATTSYQAVLLSMTLRAGSSKSPIIKIRATNSLMMLKECFILCVCVID
jgi:hypothetical protein